jgi:hypothetical protein
MHFLEGLTQKDAPTAKIERRSEGLKVRIITTAAADGWDRASLRREQLADDEMGPLLQEVEAGQRPEWKDIADRSPAYRGYWVQWKSLVVRDGVLKRLWESVDGRAKTAQIVIPRSKVKEVLTEMHGGPSGGHLGVNKTLASQTAVLLAALEGRRRKMVSTV